MRLIPGKTKVKVELFKGVSIADMVIGAVFGLLIVFVLTSSLPGKLYIAFGLLIFAVALLARMDAEPNYRYLLHILRHFGYRRNFARLYSDRMLLRSSEAGEKKAAFEALFQPEQQSDETKAERKRTGKDPAVFDMADVIAFTDIKDDLIHYGGKYYGAVLEISPVEFRFFSPMRRTASIENGVGRVLRALPAELAANIVKIERPIIFDSYIENEYNKLEELRSAYEKGVLSEDELKSRVEVLYDRINDLRSLCYDDKVLQPCYYIVLFDSDRQQLNNAVGTAIDSLRSGEINARRLNTRELAVFLKYTNQVDFDEREIDALEPKDYAAWAMPQTVTIRPRTTVINNIYTHNMRVVNYPSFVGDAWLASVMSMPATKVVVKCTPMDRAKAVRGIDRSLQELRGQYMNTGVDSKRLELQEHIETLNNLLNTLQGDNETLLEVNIYVTAYDIYLTRNTPTATQPPLSCLSSISNMKRMVRRLYQEQGMRLNNMEFDQMNAFIGAQISAWDPMRSGGRGIPSNSVAAAYPWVFAHIMDKNGIKLGAENGVPVFVDFFRRDSERVNSNMVIVGKSGSGKSYATKSLLANLAADDAKIFILDPENEYTELANNLHGKFINVGNAQFGRLNPFHIITSLDDDEEGGETVSGSYATHLQFLEEFFRQIMPDCEKDAMEYLNSIVDRMYTNMGITAETDLRTLRPEDYPVFDDLYDAILAEFQSTDNEYIRTMLRTLMNYVAKFSAGGRNANIWNGPSTVTTDENFTVFNFQSLLANRNGTIANAQMLLVLKYIDNEIIKNREYNARYHLSRKIVVVIDEAHVFIDTKYPAALDFMFQLAKRIRKYNGMQIVITQNIKDFVGSEEIARKSTAIINACQYSFIFSLAPNDMDDLCRLYEKAGGINEMEQDQIISAPRGQAFTVMSPQSHTTFRIEVPEDVVAMFEEPDYESRYFSGEDGAANWEDFLGDSREKRGTVQSIQSARAVAAEKTEPRRRHVSFEEISEAEFAASVQIERQEEFSAPQRSDTEQTSSAAAPIPPAAVQSVPQPTVQVVQVPAPAVSGETERILGELLSKFSYETMMEEIRRSVREEMSRETAGASAASGGAVGTVFNPEAMEEAARLNAAESAAAEPEPEEAPASGFDIMALLADEAAKISEISPIDMMVTYDETIIEITLEELAAYNAKMHREN